MWSATILDKKSTTRPVTKNLLHVPQFAEKFGNSTAGPTAWNSLLNHVKKASSLETFKSQLKTYLFKQSYDCCELFELMYILQHPFCLPRLCYSAIEIVLLWLILLLLLFFYLRYLGSLRI